MARYVVQRLLVVVPVLFVISLLVFLMTRLIPGDPISTMLDREQDPVVVAALLRLYNLDQPLHIQYVLWLQQIAQGSLGNSITMGQPVAGLIGERLPRTLLLMVGGVLVSLIIALPAGIYAAYRRDSWADFGITTGALLCVSMPGFWLGIMLMVVFAVYLRWLPATGYVYWQESPRDFLRHLVLPIVTLGIGLSASTVRILRSSMLDVLRQDYITLAQVKGASERRMLTVHALRNAAIPVVTVVSLEIAYLLGGAIVIERVFAYPGMGLLLISSIFARDYPVIQGTILVFAVTFVLVNLLTDIIYGFIDPRIRYSA